MHYGPMGWWPHGLPDPKKNEEAVETAAPSFNVNPPTTREEADSRVAFVRNILTVGEKHQLYLLLHDAERIRLESCKWQVQEMRDGFAKTKKEVAQGA